jgi:hypothetical protein
VTFADLLAKLKVPTSATLIQDKEFDIDSQSAHVGWGGWIAYTFALWTSPWWGVVAVLSFAAIKEGWYDQKYELDEVRGSNLRDFAFYGIGAVATASLLTVVR